MLTSLVKKHGAHAISQDADQSFDPSISQSRPVATLIIGCGNVLCGDDAIGPVLIRRMWERGLPVNVRCADGGTGGMDVAFQMRGVSHVILVDACQSGSAPGSIFELPGDEVEQLPPLTGINLHAFRWDHALAFGRWLLKEDYPQKVTVFLIEGENFQVGEALTPQIDLAINQLVERISNMLLENQHRQSNNQATIEITSDGYMRLSKEHSEQFFPEDTLVAIKRDGQLYLLPTRGAAAGGLLLKRRNARGDRSLLVSELFQFDIPVGIFTATWDEQISGLRVEKCGSNQCR
jgi:hydrogenase maturation protease